MEETKNEVALFEQQALTLMKQISDIKKAKDELDSTDAKIRKALQESMDKYGITSFKNEYVTISYVPESESVSVDLKELKEKEPECYDGLIADYPKVTKKSAYVRIVVK